MILFQLDEADLRAALVHPHVMIGSVDSLAEKFVMLRERLGITNFLVGDVGPLDAVVGRLAGT